MNLRRAEEGPVASMPAEATTDHAASGREAVDAAVPGAIGSRRIVVVLALALSLRVIWALLVPVVTESEPGAYEQLAKNLSIGYGFSLETAPETITAFIPTAYFSVGAPALYALAYAVFGQGGFAVVVLNLIVSLSTIVLAMHVACRWFGRQVATAAGLIMAVWPTFVMFTTIMSNDLLLMFCVTALMAIWTNRSAGWWPRSVLGGVALGAACLTSTSAVFLPAAMLVMAWVRREGWAKPVIAVIGAMLVATAIGLPWVMRNQERLHTFVLLTTNTGAKVYIGNHPDGDGQHIELPKKAMAMSEPYRNRRLWRDALRFIREDPGQFVKRSASKAIKMHDRETIGVAWNAWGINARWGKPPEPRGTAESGAVEHSPPRSALLGPLKVVCTGFWFLVLGGTVIGVVILAVKRGVGAALCHPALYFWGYFVAYHGVMLALDRDHLPVLPVFAMFAGLTCTSLWCLLIARKPLMLPESEPFAVQ